MARIWSAEKTRRQKRRFKGFLFFITVIAFIGGIYAIKQAYRFHSIIGTSMEPTLHSGDIVTIKKNAPIERYDIIGFSVGRKSDKFVKRVIGIPGDKIEIQQNQLLLEISEEDARLVTYTYELSLPVAERFQDMSIIPDECYFVVGDHTETSTDSRTFGWVSAVEIEGTVAFVCSLSEYHLQFER